MIYDEIKKAHEKDMAAWKSGWDISAYPIPEKLLQRESTLLSLVERARPYMKHKDDCEQMTSRDGVDADCTCKLDELLKEMGG